MHPGIVPLATIQNGSPEENLLSAKRSLRQHRHAYLHRRLDLPGDVIDVIEDGVILERHVSADPSKLSMIRIYGHTPVEEMALYR